MKIVIALEGLMFDINLLDPPGIQGNSNKSHDGEISEKTINKEVNYKKENLHKSYTNYNNGWKIIIIILLLLAGAFVGYGFFKYNDF